MNQLAYVIRCSTVGGVTGHRESVVKGGDGEVMKFVTETEAAHEALRLNMKVGHAGPAIIKYWPDTIANAQKEGYLR